MDRFTLAIVAIASLWTIVGAEDGPGVFLKNNGWHGRETYNFYPNVDGFGAIGTGMQPSNTITLEQGQETFVSLPLSFQGRVQRGSHQYSTWVEFRMTDDNGIAWGDVSLEAGYNGPATVQDAAGEGEVVGFEKRLLPLAREQLDQDSFKSWTAVTDTGLALKGPGSNGELIPGLAAWEKQVLGTFKADTKAYVAGGTGVSLAQSKANQLRVIFY